MFAHGWSVRQYYRRTLINLFSLGSYPMRPVKRVPVNKQRSAQQFRANTARTKVANMKSPMRGGWRL